jgi:protein-S-isoprenylcysteine O-methyltransferase Ste14
VTGWQVIEGRRMRDIHPFRLLMRVPVPWVFVLTYIAGALLERRWPFHLALRTQLAGAALFTAGAVTAGWSLVIFRRARTTTVPGQRSAALVTRGPYRWTRNPMYIGLTLAYLGEAGLLRHVWPVILLPLTLIYLDRVVIPVEEGRLSEVFPADYAHYRARVRRWL